METLANDSKLGYKNVWEKIAVNEMPTVWQQLSDGNHYVETSVGWKWSTVTFLYGIVYI